MHDPRVGRFFAVDPLAKKYAYNSPYAFSENKLIQFRELEGLEVGPPTYGMEYSIAKTPEDYKSIEHMKNMQALGSITGALIIVAPVILPEIAITYESYCTWYSSTQFSSTVSAGTIGTGSGWYMFSKGATNLGGQFITNDFKFNKDINLFQPFAAAFTDGFFSNALESSFYINYSFDSNNKWKFGTSSPKEFISSFTGNYLGGKVSNRFESFTKPLTDFSPSIKPMLDLYPGFLIEASENLYSDDLKNKIKILEKKINNLKIDNNIKDFKVDNSFNRKKTKS